MAGQFEQKIENLYDLREITEPIINEKFRVETVNLCKYVDEVYPDAELVVSKDFCLENKIDYVIIGEEYKDKDFTAKNICMKRNIKFVYNRRDHDFSTSSLRTRIYEQESIKRFVK